MITLTIPYEEYINLRVSLVVAKLHAEDRARQMADLGINSLTKQYQDDAAQAERLRELLINIQQEA